MTEFDEDSWSRLTSGTKLLPDETIDVIIQMLKDYPNLKSQLEKTRSYLSINWTSLSYEMRCELQDILVMKK